MEAQQRRTNGDFAFMQINTKAVGGWWWWWWEGVLGWSHAARDELPTFCMN